MVNMFYCFTTPRFSKSHKHSLWTKMEVYHSSKHSSKIWGVISTFPESILSYPVKHILAPKVLAKDTGEFPLYKYTPETRHRLLNIKGKTKHRNTSFGIDFQLFCWWGDLHCKVLLIQIKLHWLKNSMELVELCLKLLKISLHIIVAMYLNK